MLTLERLKEVLNYDAATGGFTWRVALSNRASAGSVAGSVGPNGYRCIRIDNTDHKASRLAWLYMTGEAPSRMVDHENRDRADDRWVNLRLATHAENGANSATRSSTGFKGVTWHKRGKKYMAMITTGGRSVYLGLHPTPEQAHEAYLAAARKYHGAFACSGR